MKIESPVASNLRSIEVCPGFVRDPDEKENPWAVAGTLQHKAAETGDMSELTPEQATAVTKCLDYIGRFSPSAATGDYKEHALSVPGLERRAKIDRLLVFPLVAYVFDYKFGRNSVDDAAVNNQGQAYALAVFNEFAEIEVVEVHFLSPYIDEVSKHRFDRSVIWTIQTRISTIRARQAEVAGGNVDLLNITEQCQYCGNRGVCPKMLDVILPVAKKYSDNKLAIPDNMHPSTWTTPEEFAVGLKLAKVVEPWSSSVKSHALAFVRANACEIPGYELKTREGRVSNVNTAALWNVLKDRLSLDEFLATCLAKLTDIYKLVSDKAPRGAKGKAKEDLENELTDKGLIEASASTEYLKAIKDDT